MNPMLLIKFGLAMASILLSCASTPNSEVVENKIISHIHPKNFSAYISPGPHTFSEVENFQIRVSKKIFLMTDLFLADHTRQAPLVIFQHGNRADKSRHRNQAKHLASWGFHALVVEQPNRHRWVKNGLALAKLVQLLHKWPRMIDHRYNPRNIILVGHSFGGSAIAIAAGKQAPVQGLIFLDPALVDAKVKAYLKRIKVPSIVLAADPKVFTARKRKLFYQLVKEDIVEVTIKNSTHNDAQSPHLFEFKQFIGWDHSPQPHLQERFMGAIAASVTSLTMGTTNHAWKLFTANAALGIINQRKK